MLDTSTLLAMTSIITVFVAVLFVVVWRGNTRYAGMNTIKIGTSLFAVASALSALRNTLPVLAPTCIGLANLGSIIGATMTMNGALLLAGKRPIWRCHLFVMVILLIPFTYYLYVQPSTPARAGLSALWGTFMDVSTFLALTYGPKGAGNHATRHAFAALLLIESFFEMGRGALAPFIDPHINYRNPSPILTVFFLEVIFFILGYLVLMLQLVNDRLRSDLLQSEARISSAVQVTDDAFAFFDHQNRLIMSNTCFNEYFPETAPLVRRGATIVELFGTDLESFGLEQQWLDGHLSQAPNSAVLDRVVNLKNGTWLHVSGRSPHDGGLVLCWSDITTFKQAEDVLASELARERELATLQRNFVSMASHQFRTPLAVIDINAQLLEPRGKISPSISELRERVARIRRTVTRLIRVIETMLGAANIEAGRMHLKPEPVDIASLFREAGERARELAPHRNVEICIGMLPADMHCDPTLIDQVLSNLLSNALKYSSGPSPVILRAETDGQEVVVDVADCGIGITTEDQAMIFERFFRAGNVSNVAGTGIGLTVARTIVELHGGSISVVSQIGVGSTFTIRLPIP